MKKLIPMQKEERVLELEMAEKRVSRYSGLLQVGGKCQAVVVAGDGAFVILEGGVDVTQGEVESTLSRSVVYRGVQNYSRFCGFLRCVENSSSGE